MLGLGSVSFCIQYYLCMGAGPGVPRSNLVDLASYNMDRNVFRNFNRWIERQEWRKSLPQPQPCLVDTPTPSSQFKVCSELLTAKGGGYPTRQEAAAGRSTLRWNLAHALSA